MNDNFSIGAKIKALRTSRGYTLKQLSEESGLSVGFLSQLERGMSSIAIDSLVKITDLFGIDLASFFDGLRPTETDPVVHSFDMRSTYISPQILQYVLSKDVTRFQLLPRIFLLMPFANDDHDGLEMYSHEGEEFIFVLEGIVTVYQDNQSHTLYPGDSMLIDSTCRHNWINRTNKLAKILTVNIPNPFMGTGRSASQK